jgi:monoamine oxidase
VIGAGLSGLAAALRLERLGHAVVVVEARERCGGRVLTVRDPFEDGLHAEAGAGRFSDLHARTIAYARAFGLSFDPFYPQSGLVVSHRDGERREADASLFTSQQLHAFSSYASPRHADEIPHDGVVGFLRRSMREPRWMTIRGGVDLLPRAMAAAVRGPIRYGVAVAALRHNGDGVEATLLRDGREKLLRADRAVCAVPLTTLRRIEIDPPLAGRKREILDAIAYQAAARTFLQVRERIWARSGGSGFLATDRWGEIWHSSHRQPGPRAVLTAYVRGARAREADERDVAGIARRIAEGLEQVLPGIAGLVEASARVAWHRDPWAGGSKAEIEDLTDAAGAARELAQPVGPLHFAGEHTASPSATGWMDGAIESGERAAQEVHVRAARPGVNTAPAWVPPEAVSG